MLHFNSAPMPSESRPQEAGKKFAEDSWKVLIYDELGQQIISPLLRIADLREAGITLHMYYMTLLLTEFIK